jgi:serine/threonine protein kinase
MNEVEIMIRMRHRCIIRFVGYSNPTSSCLPQIGTEYAPKGDFGELLEGRRRGEARQFSDDTSIAIILCGIVSGMQYLHCHGFMHRDLKPANVLLDSFGHAKIADFGCSRLQSANLTLTNDVGTPRYMAPEVFAGEGRYTTAVDVYSFAMILYESLVGEPAFSDVPELTTFKLQTKVVNNERPPLPPSLNPEVSEMIERCWSGTPSDRHSFDDIAVFFSRIDFKLTPDVDSQRVLAYVRTLRSDIPTEQ